MYDLIYTNGCSFTGDRIINHRYPEILEQRLHISVINRALAGCCNRRIIRSTVADIVSLPKNTLVLIQLTLWGRTEIESTGDPNTLWRKDPNDYFESIKPNDPSPYYSSWLRTHSIQTEFQNLTTDLYMLTALLRLQGLDYCIFCWVDDFKAISKDHQIYRQLKQDSRVLDLIDFSVIKEISNKNLYYDGYHLTQEGHEIFAQWIIKHVLPV